MNQVVMNQYKKSLKSQNIRLIALCAVLAALVLFGTGGVSYYDQEGMSNFIQFRDGYQIGVLAAVVAMSAVKITRNRKAIRDEEVLKQRYIAATDERARLIQEKVGEGTANLMIGVLLIAMAVAVACFQFQVFFTLLGVFLLLTLTRVALFCYYHRKY